MSDIPNTGTLKADIVSWLLAHGVSLDEEALNALTKAELLSMVSDLTDGEVEPQGTTYAAVPNTRNPRVQRLVGGYDVALRERTEEQNPATWAADVGNSPTTQQWVGQYDLAMRARHSQIGGVVTINGVDGFLAKTATAGIPGTWGPAGSLVPAAPANMTGAGNPSGIVPTGAQTAWTTGQYMQTQTAGAGGRVYWNGTVWIAGAAP